MRLIPTSNAEALEEAILTELRNEPVRNRFEDLGFENLQQVVQLYRELDPELLSSSSPDAD